VGEVTRVNPRPLQAVLDAGYVAVVAPVAVTEDAAFLNVNGDTAASAVAVGLPADRFVLLTDVDGVRGADGSPIRLLQESTARALIEDSVISGGMIPKVEACLLALTRQTTAQIVDGRRPHALLAALAGSGQIGTAISADPPV